MLDRTVGCSITGLLQKGGFWFAILLAPCASGVARYVCVSNSTPVAPYTNWATAATSIQAAVVAAANGDTVWVSNGVYSAGTVVTPGGTLNNRVAVTNGVIIRSVNGPQVTIIEGSGYNSYNTTSAVRCVYMNSGTLDGFTLRGGATYGSAQSGAVADYDRNGGGVNRYGAISGTTVTNCIIRDCRATAGGGAFCGTLETCFLSENTSVNWGGGAFSCVLNNCTLTNNTSLTGGGASSCVLNNCTLSGNGASSSGGGSDYCTLSNCSLSGNSAYYGGGAYAGTLNNCALSGNTAVNDGGGAYGGSTMHCTLKNCTLTGNKAMNGGGAYNCAMDNCTLTDNSATYGGGAYYNTLNNCTLSGNGASISGGGAYYNTLNNCIAWGNTNQFGAINNYDASAIKYSCTDPLPAGTGNVSADPQFVDPQNLRLRTGSPCIDAGTNEYVTLPTDLAGNTRILNGTVDMGAFEGGFLATARPVFIPPSGTLFAYTLDVSVTCATERAVIRFTLDGSEPTETSAEYTGPFTLTETTTVQAKAFREGLLAARSIAQYAQRVATPVISPVGGTTGTNYLVVTIACDTPQAVIRYTLNGSEPTASSSQYLYPLVLNQSGFVRAKAFRQGWADSLIATIYYTVIFSVSAPQFTPASGTCATNMLSVALSCSTASASIRYTLDGSAPTGTSTLYQSGAPIILTQTTTVKARGYKSGMADSDVATASYTVIQTVATPLIQPADGTRFTGLLKIVMSCATEGVEIRYTTDGPEPASGSLLYVTPFNIAQTTAFKAKAFKDGWIDSLVHSATHYLDLPLLSEAVDMTNLVVATDGAACWFAQTNVTHDGIDAAQSGDVADNQSAWMETSVAGPGALSFWWKASCEDDPDEDDWDYLAFTIDGAEQQRLDGLTGWQQVTCTLNTGTHKLRWTYSKDGLLSDGADCAWVDQLSFIPGMTTATTTTPVPVPFSWLNQYPTILGMAGGDYEIAAFIDADFDGHAAWQEYVTGSVPTNRESVFRTLMTVSNGMPWLTWAPNLGTSRIYTVTGKTNLNDSVWGPTNSASRFFKVNADMP